MALIISANHLQTKTHNNNFAGYSSDSISPTAGNLVLVGISYSCAGTSNVVPPTSISGASTTWTRTNYRVHNNRGVGLYQGIAAGTGALSITFPVTMDCCIWHIDEFFNVDAVTPIVQSGSAYYGVSTTGGNVSLSAFTQIENAAYGVITKKATSPVKGATYTQLSTSSGDYISGGKSEWKNSNDTTVDWTWASNSGDEANLVGCEINAANPVVVPGNPMFFSKGLTLG